MYCNHCGKPNRDDAQYCAFCYATFAGAMTPRQLVRPRYGRRIAGVCAGVAQHYGWNVTTVRLLWFLAFIFGGTGGLLYIILWIVMPNAG
jgi:phage shock protein PspC (stress-responsive transcriptional regulator)